MAEPRVESSNHAEITIWETLALLGATLLRWCGMREEPLEQWLPPR